MSSEGLKRLKVWTNSKELVVQIYRRVIPELPVEEKYALSQQIRRAAQSIPANIAEGYGRYYYQENIRFCYVARGSLEETINYLIISFELGYLSHATYEEIIQKADNLTRLMNGYIAYLKRTKHGEDDPDLKKGVREMEEMYILEDIVDDISNGD